LPYALLVDDNAAVRARHRATLELDGWDVEDADECDSALDCMRRKRPDVVLLALQSPRARGLHLLQEMLVDDELRGIPRVVISGGSDPVERRFALKLGAAAWLSSPVTPSRLLAAAWDHHSDAHSSDGHEETVPPR
jgi:CheY-like chemotaxis protein